MYIAENGSLLMCGIHINLYDCIGSQQVRTLAIICLVSVAITFLCTVGLIAYRMRRGLFTQLLVPTGDYRLPAPLDAFLLVGAIYYGIRILTYTFLLFDWPQSLIFRYGFNAFSLPVALIASSLFTIGIISQIPSVTVRGRRCYALTGDTLDDAAATTARHHRSSSSSDDGRFSRRLLIRLPTHRTLFRFLIIYCAQLMLVTPTVAFLGGWAAEQQPQRMDWMWLSWIIEPAVMALSVLVILIITGYYCSSFYRIMQGHTRRLRKLGLQVSDDAVQAARRFRNVFLAIFVVQLVAASFSVFTSLFAEQLFRNLSLYIGVYAFQFAFFYQLIGLLILYNIFRTSRACVRRSEARSGSASKVGDVSLGAQHSIQRESYIQLADRNDPYCSE